jgi:hypothetical protein
MHSAAGTRAARSSQEAVSGGRTVYRAGFASVDAKFEPRMKLEHGTVFIRNHCPQGEEQLFQRLYF